MPITYSIYNPVYFVPELLLFLSFLLRGATDTITHTLTFENLNLTHRILELTHPKPITALSNSPCNETPNTFQLVPVSASKLKLSLFKNIHHFFSYSNPIYSPYIPCTQSIYTFPPGYTGWKSATPSAPIQPN